MKPIEENLDLPLREVLKIMQEQSFQNKYFGVGAIKNPLDWWIYQEIIYETKPDVIIEIGNYSGGTLLALAHMCDLRDYGIVIGVDINHDLIPAKVKQHKRIKLVTGDACQQFETIKSLVEKDDRVIIIEDSAHTYENTLNVLRLYSTLVKVGDYFIVEDSICRHGLDIGQNPGPYEAINTFLDENSNFIADRNRERFLITWNPKGFLWRTK